MSFTPVALDLHRGIANAVRSIPLTAKQIARRVGVTPRAVAGWKAGDSVPSLEAALAMCREFDAVWLVMMDAAQRAQTVSEAEQVLADITNRLEQRRQNAPSP